MTGNKCIVDTSVVIDAFKNQSSVSAILDSMDIVFVPVTVIGELYFGALRAKNTAKHAQQINAFLNNCQVLQIDTLTAETYGRVKAELASKGKPIPENDIWIAALALQHGLPLFANDKHFEYVDHIVLL